MTVHALSRNETPATIERVTTPERLIEAWPHVRPGLVAIKKRQHTQGHWEPENVRQSIVLGQSELWLVLREDCIVGFTITQLTNDPFLNIPYSLFIWIAWSRDGGVDEAEWTIEEYARSRGCRYLEALTQRKGLARRLARYGWEETNICIRKDLYPEGQTT